MRCLESETMRPSDLQESETEHLVGELLRRFFCFIRWHGWMYSTLAIRDRETGAEQVIEYSKSCACGKVVTLDPAKAPPVR